MLREHFEHQNVAKSIENERFELQNAVNTLKTAASSSKMLLIPPKCCKFYGNERFQLQNVAKTVEMAASSSKMLQIVRKTGRKADQTKKTKREKNNSQNNSGPIDNLMGYELDYIYIYMIWCNSQWVWCCDGLKPLTRWWIPTFICSQDTSSYLQYHFFVGDVWVSQVLQVLETCLPNGISQTVFFKFTCPNPI